VLGVAMLVLVVFAEPVTGVDRVAEKPRADDRGCGRKYDGRGRSVSIRDGCPVQELNVLVELGVIGHSGGSGGGGGGGGSGDGMFDATYKRID